MIRVEVFRPDDLVALKAHDAAAAMMALSDHDRRALGESIAAQGRAFTGWIDGRAVFCGGAIEHHKQYATVWAVLEPLRGRKLMTLTRMVRDYLAKLPHRRVDVYVQDDFRPGHRWVRRLGFRAQPDAVIEDYCRGGQAAAIYRLEI